MGVAVALAALGVASGLYLGHRRTATSQPTGNNTEQAPIVTTPASVVSGDPGGSPGPAEKISARVQSENARPGSSGWKLTDVATNGEIEGFAERTSINSGDPINLDVSTSAPTFRAEAYRMGYYHGSGARLIWSSPDTAGARQAKPSFTSNVNMIEAHWAPSLTVATQGWPEGDYLFKLVASTGKQHYVPLTVRNDSSTSAYVILNAVTTWQAYNLWGGYSLYEGKNGNGSDFDHRSRIVSFDRPYTLGDGAGDFLGLEFPLVSLTESLGLDVSYLTDVDIHQRPEALLARRAVLSLGHDEYYSLKMRNALQTARDQGVNLAFLGANAIYRHIRFEPSPIGPDRHQIDYKSAGGDPLYGKDDADVTVSWRDPPNNDPESQIIGNFYQCNPVRADMVIVDPANWLFAGTGVVAGQRLHDVVGSEYDRYDARVPGPSNVEILAHSPLTCHGRADFADATYYSATSGAGVFAAGTIDFVGHMDANCQPEGCPGRVLGKVIQNLLSAFGAGPAGLVHPSDPAQSGYRPPPPVNARTTTTAPPSARH